MPECLVEKRGHILIVTMNRPEARNALSTEMMRIMTEAWDQVDADPDIRVAILTGAGGFFCAGGDLKDFAAAPSRGRHIKGVADDLHRAISTFAGSTATSRAAEA